MVLFYVHVHTYNTGEALLTIVIWFHQGSHAENTLSGLRVEEKWQLIDSKIKVVTSTDTFLQLKFWPIHPGVMQGADAHILGKIIATATEQWGVIRKLELIGSERNPLTGDLPSF